MIPLSFGAADAWNAYLYDQPHQGTLDFIQQQFADIRHHFTNAGSRFLQRAQEAISHYQSAQALRFARKMAADAKGVFQTPHIERYTTLSEMQQASPLMQRWLMANPTIRTLYHQQRCDGYADSYHDWDHGLQGSAHYDYRRVMNHLVVDDGENWKVTHYLDELREGDRELILEEQVAIRDSWAAMDVLLAMCTDDPTGPEGSQR